MALCPYCGQHNERWRIEEIKPGELFPAAPHLCAHHVFEAPDRDQSGVDYVHQVLYLNLYKAPQGVFGTDVSPNILEILKKHFTFVDDMAFARSGAEKEAARKEVSTYLHALGYEGPPP